MQKGATRVWHAPRAAWRTLEDKPVAVILLAAGTTIVVSYLLAASAGWARVDRILYANHPWAWLAACLLAEVVAYVGYVLTIRDIARVDDGPDMEITTSAQTVVAGFGVFAATRSNGGFAVDYWALRREGASRRDAFRRVLALGYLEFVTLSIVALVASVALYLRVDGQGSAAAILPSFVVLPVFVLSIWATSSKRVGRLSTRRRDQGTIRRWIADWVAAAAKARTLLSSPREHGLGVLGMTLYWAGDIVCLWAAMQLVGGPRMSLSALILAYSGGYVLSRRSLPAGGAGVVEVALTYALVGMGAPFAPAVVGVLIYRLFNFWLPIVPALTLMPTVRELRQRFHRAEEVA
jgi:uncharacterized membrane protein YbhN (UPF0104 family)